MSAKTKIVVLRMKELIYTGIFAALGILLIILMIILFFPGKDKDDTTVDTPTSGTASIAVSESAIYIPGVYTTELVLNDRAIDVEVIVNQAEITSLRLINLSEAIATMYPLLEPTFENICSQVYEKQSLEGITYEADHKYTSLVLLEAIRSSLEKAQVTAPDHK